MVKIFSRKDLQEVLMDPKALGVKEPYYVIKGESGENITVIAPGKNGIEYNKTYGYFQTYAGIEIFQCLYGQGAIILQRNSDEGQAKEIRIVSLRPGTIIEAPSGYLVTIVNTGKNLLAVLDNSQGLEKYHRTEPVREKHGLAYYIVEKKGEISVEKNPNYSYHPEVTF